MRQVKLEELIPVFRRNSAFSLLTDSDIGKLSKKMTLLHFSVGDVIVHEGEVGHHAYLIYSGRVRIVKQSDKGRVVSLGTQGAGDFFGEQAILNDTTRTASVRAVEGVALFRIEQEDFRELVDSDPKLASYVENFMNDAGLRDFLRTSTFLESTKPNDITSLLDHLEDKKFAANTIVLKEGDPGDCMYIVRSGQLQVERRFNGSPKVVRYLRRGEYFGEWALMTGEVRSATVTTLSDTHCYLLSRVHFDELLNSAPKLRDQLVERFRRYRLDDELEDQNSNDEFDESARLAQSSSDAIASDGTRPASSSEPASETESTTRDSKLSGNAKQHNAERPAGEDEICELIPDEWKQPPNGWTQQRPQAMWQHTESDCGPTALAMVAAVYGLQFSITMLRSKSNVGRNGTSLFELSKTAESIGFETQAYRTSSLDEVALPAIAHCGDQHFVTVFRVSKSSVLIGDPARGIVKLDRVEFNAKWSGNVLLLRPTDAVRQTKQQVPIQQRMNDAFAADKHLTALALCSALICVVAIVSPWSIGQIVDGSASPVYYVGSLLILLWPILSSIRQRRLQAMWSDSPIASDRRLLETLAQFREGSINRVAESVRLLNARNVIQEGFVGAPLVGWLNVGVLFIVTLVMLLIDAQLGLIAFGAGLLSSWLGGFGVRRNSHKLFSETTSKVHSEIQLLEKAQSGDLIRALQLPTSCATTTPPLYESFSPVAVVVLLATACGVLLMGVAADVLTQGALTTFMLLFFVRAFTLLPYHASLAYWPQYRWYFDQLWDRSLPLRISDAEYAPTAPGLRSIADQGEPVAGNEQTVQSTTPTITFEDINFAYGAGLPNAISGVSFEIEAGQQVAVVGRSGSGKSTLLKLMRGALVPDSGRVLIDGSELADVDSNKRNRIFGAALQNAKLFTGTIRENIGFNTDEDQVERIKDAARQVNAHQFIEALPFGYETTVGANGRSLPAGRVQRICLARSVFHAPSVVVWDEATAAMDIDSERRLYNRIEAWPTDRTSIIATRRLRNIQNADVILVMSEGAIVEQGTHPELIDTRGLYYYLCCQHAME